MSVPGANAVPGAKEVLNPLPAEYTSLLIVSFQLPPGWLIVWTNLISALGIQIVAIR